MAPPAQVSVVWGNRCKKNDRTPWRIPDFRPPLAPLSLLNFGVRLPKGSLSDSLVLVGRDAGRPLGA